MTGARALAPGLPPDEIERLRWQTCGQTRVQALRSGADLARFVAAHGVVLVAPLPGVTCPSALEAAVGRPLLDHAHDERGATLEAWIHDAATSERWTCAAALAGRRSLVADAFLADVRAAAGRAPGRDEHERMHATGKLGADARAVCAALAAVPAHTLQDLRAATGLAGIGREPRWARALEEARAALLVAETVVDGDAGLALLDAASEDAPAARARIAGRHLQNVLLVSASDCASLFGWDETDAVAALEDLVRSGAAAPHPASRPRRPLVQATHTDLLPRV